MSVHVTDSDFALRGFREGDADALFAHLSDFAVTGWLGRVPYPYKAEDAEEWLARDHPGWPRRAAVEVDGTLAGAVTVDGHLGYWLAPIYWRRGIMSRATANVVDAYFDASDADRIDSGAFEGNAASLRLLGKLGFVERGTRQVFSRSHGEKRPHIDMRLSRANREAQA